MEKQAAGEKKRLGEAVVGGGSRQQVGRHKHRNERGKDGGSRSQALVGASGKGERQHGSMHRHGWRQVAGSMGQMVGGQA